METERLTKRETQIMNVLWSSDEPLSAHDILVLAPELSRNTIQIVLKKLQTIGFIEVAGFGYNKNALTRTFRPIISQSQYIQSSLAEGTSYELAMNFIKQTDNPELLDQLAELIKEKKQELNTPEAE
ncbi:BlaI/MecI/CopY family transcriptional regulator [Ileibacterium valens]|uniref:BlaI/MecI/CopY family transcriptional regulator n=1 Tax=Ileibacterium valens TaxID=1862668 RepID=UPI002352EDFE|nr:BlaI/MecI/CopY family transcriptional regulator [Ileibacterium valens]